MQTGVMAYRRNERVAAFWEETRKVAHARQTHTRRCIPPLSRSKRTLQDDSTAAVSRLRPREGGATLGQARVISAVSRRKVYLEKGGAYWRLRSSGELRSEI